MAETRITDLAWGQIEVATEGNVQRFKDCKIWPGGAREWRWEETGTHHNPGIQPADLEDVLKKDVDVIVLGSGQLGRLKISPETEMLLHDRGIPYHLVNTEKAVQLFNALTQQGKRVGGLFHSTC